MTSLRGRGRPHHKRFSAAPSVTPPDSFSPSESGEELSNQPAGPSETKPPIANAPTTDINIPKYFKDGLQQILKAVLEARALAPTPVPVPVLALALVLTPAPAPAPIVTKAP